MDHRGLRARLTGAGCTSCGAAVSIDRIAVLADRGDLAFVELDCPACGSRTMSLVLRRCRRSRRARPGHGRRSGARTGPRAAPAAHRRGRRARHGAPPGRLGRRPAHPARGSRRRTRSGRVDRARGIRPRRGGPSPSFAHASEAELARILDFYEVRWAYEPDTFPIGWNLDGDVVESFSPDFYLPDLDLYVELTTLKQKLVRKKNRKLRRLRELYPDVHIKLFYARDFRMLLLKFGRLALIDDLTGTTGQATPPRVTPDDVVEDPTIAVILAARDADAEAPPVVTSAAARPARGRHRSPRRPCRRPAARPRCAGVVVDAAAGGRPGEPVDRRARRPRRAIIDPHPA